MFYYYFFGLFLTHPHLQLKGYILGSFLADTNFPFEKRYMGSDKKDFPLENKGNNAGEKIKVS